MKNYWSCSTFADWLRGTMKPDAETSKGWRSWENQAKASHPFRYWLAEEGLDKIQKFVTWPADQLYSLKYYINNRWVTKTHALTSHPRDIPRGEWRDVGYRFLPCLFNELVEFVEVEQAWINVAWNEESRKKYKSPWWSIGWFRWRTWRCPEAGIDYLNWAANLKYDEDFISKDDPVYGQPTPQALAAQEILELYKWWTEVYRKRPDVHDASGWSEFCDRKRKDGDDLLDFESETPEEREESRRILDICHKMEQEYEEEDTEMLIRLIKVRHHLWT